MYSLNYGAARLIADAVGDGIFRVRLSAGLKPHPSLLTRFNFLSEPAPNVKCEACEGEIETVLKLERTELKINRENPQLLFKGLRFGVELVLPSLKLGEEGFAFTVSLENGERIYGLGDESRDGLNKRGRRAVIWLTDITSYGPIPFMISSNGWGMFVNSTYRMDCDIGATDPEKIVIRAEKGELDIYLFSADSPMGVLQKYTEIAGKPILLPKSAYGLTFVENEESGAREMLDDCVRFRREDIPCDIIGLEPGWMSKYYDFSVEKAWNNERFWLPWEPYQTIHGNSSEQTFFANLRHLNFKLSLWLCCDYDLLWEECRKSFADTEKSYSGAAFKDAHLASNIRMDKLTVAAEPWFKHLEKFVDNGAFAFKLDAANQALEHPDRLWAGEFFDDEVHNVYPVIYARQMKEGFEVYTKGRRAMIYTPAIFVGTQKYAATWAGDTGGGAKSLISVLNLAVSAVSNASCDMDHDSPEGIHFGFLAPWAQLCSWRYWFQPWYLGDELCGMIRRYSKLRSALLPYIYSMAHKATQTGIPLARPMCLAFPNWSETLDAANMYMLGDSLLVLAFDMHASLPEGKWLDLFKNELFDGGCKIEYSIPEGFGGGLFAKPGAIIPSCEPKPYAMAKNIHDYTVTVTRGGTSEFVLVEDDGVSNTYISGHCARTRMTLSDDGDVLCFALYIREGGYEVNENEKYDKRKMSENHPSNIPLPEDVCGFKLVFYTDSEPETVTLNGEPINICYTKSSFSVYVSRELHESMDVFIKAEF